MVDIDGGHLIDTLQFIFGPIASVTAHLVNQYPTVQIYDSLDSGNPVGSPLSSDDIHQIVIGGQFANKDETVLSVNLRNVLAKDSAGLFWVIDGEKGAIRIEADAEAGFTVIGAKPDVWLNGEKLDVEKDSYKQRVTRYFENFANGKEGEYATIEDALNTKKVIDALFRSSREGKRIDL
jgi:predicted dehydrogenase